MDSEVHDLRVQVDTVKMKNNELERRLGTLERRLHLIEEWGFWFGVIFVGAVALQWILKGAQ